MNVAKSVPSLMAALADRKVKTATKFLGPQLVVKMTRQHRRSSGGGETFLFTFGKPNYAERVFVTKCKKVGVPFPVRKVQLKRYPPKR